MSNIKTISNLDDLKLACDFSEGYMVTVSLLNKGELNHFLLTKRFPKIDILKSLKVCKQLAIEDLENATNDGLVEPTPIKTDEVTIEPVSNGEENDKNS